MSNFIISSKLYKDGQVYAGPAFAVKAIIDGKEFGQVGEVTADGQLTVTLPQDMPTDVLSERAPGMFGGTLVFAPAIAAQKDGNPLYVVYVNQDAGPYKAGWSYANHEHAPITADQAADYIWELK